MKRERKPLRPGKGKWLNFIYGILRLSVFLVLIAQFFNRDYESVFLCILTLFLFQIGRGTRLNSSHIATSRMPSSA